MEDAPDVDMLALSLDQLAKTATRLKEQSDGLRASIRALDSRISSLGIGLSAWVNFQGKYAPGSDIPKLGYDRGPNGVWGLVVKTSEGEWMLSQAPRFLAYKSIYHIPALLQKIAETAEEMINKTAKAALHAHQMVTAMASTLPAMKENTDACS